MSRPMKVALSVSQLPVSSLELRSPEVGPARSGMRCLRPESPSPGHRPGSSRLHAVQSAHLYFTSAGKQLTLNNIVNPNLSISLKTL